MGVDNNHLGEAPFSQNSCNTKLVTSSGGTTLSVYSGKGS